MKFKDLFLLPNLITLSRLIIVIFLFTSSNPANFNYISLINIIDLIVAASHGDLDLNNIVEPGCNLIGGCTKAWLPYFKSKK